MSRILDLAISNNLVDLLLNTSLIDHIGQTRLFDLIKSAIKNPREIVATLRARNLDEEISSLPLSEQFRLLGIPVVLELHAEDHFTLREILAYHRDKLNSAQVETIKKLLQESFAEEKKPAPVNTILAKSEFDSPPDYKRNPHVWFYIPFSSKKVPEVIELSELKLKI